jgi:hydrogenase expression/formation protein HypC
MCLAIPGRIVGITGDQPMMRFAQVDFGGVGKQINLAYVPQAAVGDYVLVHVGFALTVIDEAEAQQIFADLERIAALTRRAEAPA